MNKCLNCKKKYHCCIAQPSKGYIFVGVNEAKRIKNKTKISYSEFLTFSKLDKKLASESKKDSPYSEAKLRADLMIDGRILRMKVDKNGKCVFLKDGKCSIYKHRPLICQMYPFWFNKEFELIHHPSLVHCDLIDKDFLMTDREFTQLKKTAQKIIKEAKIYKKQIKKFATKNKID